MSLEASFCLKRRSVLKQTGILLLFSIDGRRRFKVYEVGVMSCAITAAKSHAYTSS